MMSHISDAAVKFLADQVRKMPDATLATMYMAHNGAVQIDTPPDPGKVAKKAARGPRKQGTRGGAQSLDRQANLVTMIRAAGGLGINAEGLGKQLGMASAKFAKDVKALVGAGKVRFEGERRARKYFAVPEE